MCLSILSVLCPPCAVGFKRGCGCDFLINVLLSILGWVPGCIHACCIGIFLFIIIMLLKNNKHSNLKCALLIAYYLFCMLHPVLVHGEQPQGQTVVVNNTQMVPPPVISQPQHTVVVVDHNNRYARY